MSGCDRITDFKSIIQLLVNCLFKQLLYLMISIAVIIFVYGVIKYVIQDGDKKEAKNYILWGVVGLFVMVSFWALVGILRYTFSI